jgi:hypothetical protein
MRVLITGATGFVGRRLQAFLARAGHTPVTVSRGAGGQFQWDPNAGPLPAAALSGVHAVVHLAGENIGKGRWSKDKKQRIRDSRIVGTRNLVEGIAQSPNKPRVVFCASAIGYYGDRGDDKLAEDSEPGSDFLALLCKDWEEEASKSQAHGARWISGRFGIILGEEDGALPAMLPPFRMGVGGPIGSGKQWMSWIHVEDVCGLILHSIERISIQGPINIVSPVPVINRDFAQTLASLLGRMALFRTPYFVLRMAVGEFARYLIGSQRVVPIKAMATNYIYKYRELEPALRDCLKKYIAD